MLLLAIFGIFWNTTFLNALYCWLGVVLFGIYVDEYVAAAMLLYVDIIQIFLYILSLMSSKK
jgi:FtsH-binding integral membrane protein